jgi:hypothetical protein
MSFQLPNNIAYAVASAYAASINVSAATNATECVLTTATNTYAVGDFLEFTSGWSKATGRVFRAKAVTTTSVTLEGFDTTDTVQFPAGAGSGSLRKISTWTPIVQVLGCDPSGGDAKYASVQLMDSDTEISLPDGFSATTLNMSIADDLSQPHNAVLRTASNSMKVAALKCVLQNGNILLYSGYVSFNENPTQTKSQAMAVKAGFALTGKVVRYAS